MRNKAAPIIMMVIAGISAFVLFAVVWSKQGPRDIDDPDFFNAARAGQTGSHLESGTLPGLDEDPEAFPEIELETDHFDFGTISNKEPTIKEFRVTNRGVRDLIIHEVKTSCICTTGYFGNSYNPYDPEPVVIPPGKSLPMKIRLNPFRVPQFKSAKTLSFQTNDPLHPNASLLVTATVDPEFAIEPRGIDLGTIDAGARTTGMVILRQLNDDPFEVTGVEAGPKALVDAVPGLTKELGGVQVPAYELAFAKRPEESWTIPGKAEWEIAITTTPNLPAGAFQDQYIVSTNCKRLPKIMCSFKVDVKAFFEVSPPFIVQPAPVARSAGSLGTALVVGHEPIELQDLSIDDDTLSVSSQPGPKPNSIQIAINIPPDCPPGQKRGTVSFTVVTADGKRATQRMIVLAVVVPDEASDGQEVQ